MVKGDQKQLGIRFDRFSSERALVESGGVEVALKVLKDGGLL